MMKLTAFMLLFVSRATSFSAAPFPMASCRQGRRSSSSSSHLASSSAAEPTSDQDRFYRAVEICDSIRSSNSKMDIEELDRWATELEKIQGCVFEEGNQELCDKEIQDRLDIAQILRLEIELQLRLEYLKNHSNLFSDDVRKYHDKVERQKFKQALVENRGKMPEDGSDLGLW